MDEFEKAVSEIDERSGNVNDENVIESANDKDIIDYCNNSKGLMTVLFTRKKWVNRIKQYAEQYPSEVQIKYINTDGSIIAHVPVSYLRIVRPTQLSDSEKKRRAEILKRVNAR